MAYQIKESSKPPKHTKADTLKLQSFEKGKEKENTSTIFGSVDLLTRIQLSQDRIYKENDDLR